MEHNPYQAPAAAVADVADEQLAGRGERFGAAFIDGLIMIAIVFPIMFATGYWQAAMSGQRPGLGTQLLYALMGFVIFIIVQAHPLRQSAQTWGKRVMKIRIVDLQGQQPSLATLVGKRYLPMQAVSSVPLVGNLLALVNILLIFRADRRCGHDLVAGTRVVKAA